VSAPDTERLIVRREGDVLHLRLNRPEVRNALDEELIAAVTGALRTDAREDEVRVVVLGGEGKVFCAGADLQYMQRLAAADFAANLEDARRLGELFSMLSSCPRPVVARVHGAAIGGGVGLVAAADFVIAAEGTKFGFTETRLGIVPGVISPFALRRLGPATCRRLFLTGEVFDSERALGYGLVDEVVPVDELDERVDALVSRLRVAGPHAQSAAKRLLDEIGNLPVEDAVAQTPEHIARQRAAPEAREGFAAFLEKRSPKWLETGKK
jgi:methylglutaconyl-CoA hydratase